MMNKPQILKKIGVIIQELNEQHQYLTNTNKINLLELELFTANADFLIDHIEILKKINSYIPEEAIADLTPAPQKTVKKEEPVVLVSPPVQEITPIVAIENSEEEEVDEKEEKRFFDFSFNEEPTEMVFDFEKKISVDEVFDRELSEEEKQLLKQKEETSKIIPQEEVLKVVEEEISAVNETEYEDEIGEEPYIFVKEEEVKPEPIIEQTIPVVVEKPTIVAQAAPIIKQQDPIIEEKRPTLNEMLSAKLGHSASHAITSSKSVSDLKTAISINDKMVFIKELFNGYNLAYSEAIEIINRFESFEAADNFLVKNYAQKNDWTNKTATVDRFYDYLNRKFIK